MKQNLTRLAQQYETALRTHLEPGARTSLVPALGLGRQAVTFGLETLELARMHERALAIIKLSNPKNGLNGSSRRAEIFFTEANAPIVETHRAVQRSKIHLNRMKEALGRRTEELAATNRRLQRGIVRRKVARTAAKKSGLHYKKCLEESLELQKRLRQLTHRVLTAQENQRKSISLELHDEIAQTLLGINIRLLSLKREARINHKGFKKEIASTQRLVGNSVKSVRRVARELGDA